VTSVPRRLPAVAAAAAVALLAGLPVVTPAARAAGPCDPPVVSPIACENSLPGSPSSEWDIDGNGDDTIQGFATDMSVNKGQTVRFKVKTTARAYRLDIYRIGYYGGDGARKVATVNPSAALPQSQPACIDQSSTTGLVDCGNWAESASWAVPATAVSGIYVARLVRTDNGGASHIVFVVRDDASTSAALFQTADTTWQAYNSYGGNSLYLGAPAGRAYKVSYNRPFNTRGTTPWGRDFVWANEYPMVRWMEANGYDVTYTTGVDSDRRGQLIKNHKVFLSVGHDEYWSGPQRAHVEAARDAGVHLAFFAGNAVYWKTRWENSVDGSGTPYRTLVSYKETKANAQIDPLGPSMWTGTWRDPRFSPPGDGGRPENELMGTLFQVNSGTAAIKVPEADGKMRLWRNTSVASLAAGTTATLAAETLGYEWDEDRDNGFRPEGLFRLSSTTESVPEYLLDYGSTVGPATATHHLTMYRAPSGALVFGAGTIQWAWGLDSNHDGTPVPPDARMQQATVNLFADMGVQPATLRPGLALAAKSSDTTAPAAVISSPAAGAVLNNASTVTVTGTASDTGGRVAAVEVSTDGGTTWHPATGRASWSYPLSSVGAGPVSIKARAVDDSGNIQTTPATVAVTVECPCQMFSNSSVPVTPSANDPSAVELGVKFRSDVDAYVTGIRFYKGTGNTGTHTGSLWTSTGTRLASATFTLETATGWQQVSFATPILIAANTTYVASYYAPNGRYAADTSYFAAAGVDSPPLHALRAGVDGENGVYRYGAGGGFPTNSYRAENYWVDVVVTTNTGPDTTPPAITATAPAAGTNGNPTTTPVRATFSEAVQPSSISFVVRDAANAATSGSVAYDAPSRTATFTPASPLPGSTTFTATVAGAQDAAGNTMAPHTWSFTTAAPPGTCPCSIWTGSTVPATAAEADPGAVELGVKFRADLDGYITGVRFYKGAGNNGTHVGNLWTTSGTRLATATFTNESETGWQQVTFPTPVAVAANTTYVASYHAPLGHYAADGGYFAGGGADSPPLHALASGVDGSNGVYAYGPGGFPSQSYNNTNYWVDVVFVTSLAPPTTTTTTTTATTTTTVPPTTTTTVAPTTTTTTTTLPAPRTFTDTSTADFAGGTFSSGVTSVATGDGEVSLRPTAGSEFSGSSLPSGWASTTLATGGSSTVSGGALTVNGARAGTSSTYGRGRSLEFVATFSGAANQSAGFGVDFVTNQWAMFGTSTGNALYARSRAGSSATNTTLTGVALGVPHLFRIDWNSSSVVYSVDGVVRATHTVSSGSSLRPLVADGAATGGAVVVDWMRMTPYSTSGTYTSKVFDAGASGPWGTASWTASLPAGTAVTVSVRTGNTATPGTGWSSWRTLSGSGASIAATSRYIQYRVTFSTSSNRFSPALADITLRWRT
jgi:hypothetical protein